MTTAVALVYYSLPERRYKYNRSVVSVGLVVWGGYNCLMAGVFEAVVVSHTWIEGVMMRVALRYFVV